MKSGCPFEVGVAVEANLSCQKHEQNTSPVPLCTWSIEAMCEVPVRVEQVPNVFVREVNCTLTKTWVQRVFLLPSCAKSTTCIPCLLVDQPLWMIQVTIRHAKSHPHPKVTNVKPDHNHVINREAAAVKGRLARKLTEEQKYQVTKMTGEHRTCRTVQRPHLDSRSLLVLSCLVPRSATLISSHSVGFPTLARVAAQGMKPKEVATALEALHPDSCVNHRAVQNAAAAAAQAGAERPFDATDAYKQVRT